MFRLKLWDHKDFVLGFDLALFNIIINPMSDEIQTCISHLFYR